MQKHFIGWKQLQSIQSFINRGTVSEIKDYGKLAALVFALGFIFIALAMASTGDYLSQLTAQEDVQLLSIK